MAGETDLTELLPQHKHDHERFQRLRNLGYPAIAPVLPGLFEWVQDMNWPVAGEVASFLSSLGGAVQPQVKTVLEGDDGMWKYWVLSAIIAPMPREELQLFVPVL